MGPRGRAGAPPAPRCLPAWPRRRTGTRTPGRGPAVQSRHAREPGTSRGGKDGVGAQSAARAAPAAPSAPRRPPARGRSAARAPPGSGARNSAAGARPPRSPRAPWRGGAAALPGRRGGSGLRPEEASPGRGAGSGAGIGAGPGAARAVGGGD